MYSVNVYIEDKKVCVPLMFHESPYFVLEAAKTAMEKTSTKIVTIFNIKPNSLYSVEDFLDKSDKTPSDLIAFSATKNDEGVWIRVYHPAFLAAMPKN